VWADHQYWDFEKTHNDFWFFSAAFQLIFSRAKAVIPKYKPMLWN